MKVKNWKKLFLPHILERGENYYLNDAVEDLNWDGETLSATVYGTDDYDVEISISDGRVEDFYCSCPYAEDGTPCKHMAAVLFQFTETDDVPGGKKNQKAAKPESGPPLESLVEAMNAGDAKTLLLRLGREIGAVETQIRLFATGKVPQKQQQDWLSRITRLRRQYEDRHGFIPYDRVADYTGALDEVLEEAVSMLLGAGMPREAFQVVCAAFQEASEAEMDDSDGELYLFWESCGAYWREVLQAADSAQRGEMHDWFAKSARSNLIGDGKDIIREILFHDFHEETLLHKNLELLDRWISETGTDADSDIIQRHFLETCLRWRLHTMEMLFIPPAEREAWLRKFYRTPFVRRELLKKAKAAEDWEEALRILRESIEIDREMPGLTDEYHKEIIAILRRTGRGDELREALRSYVTEHFQDSLDYVQELKELTPAEEWEALREELLKSPGMQRIRGDLLLQEGQHRRLMDELLHAQKEYLMDRYAPELRKHFPAELLDFYLPRVERAMRMASDRNRYAELCTRLKVLRDYPGGTERAREVAQAWREAYPRRRAMLEELKKAGF